MDEDEELQERRDAELEFVNSAYGPDEARVENIESSSPVIRRRLELDDVEVILSLTLTPGYPEHQALEVSANVVDDSVSSNAWRKAAWNSIPKLLDSCREIAKDSLGAEAVFSILSRADEFVLDDWPAFRPKMKPIEETEDSTASCGRTEAAVVLGRRLIYSHHIISKVKRSNIRSLASQLHLTGYMKIGWPGLLLVEGLEEDCIEFYDAIRPWSWQYLVVRGEQQERMSSSASATIDKNRKFDEFREVDDMSVVAQHCRDVGLEALFRTSMKVYKDNQQGETDDKVTKDLPYGALVLVDHMNDPKGYRKWLRKTRQEVGGRSLWLMIKQSYPLNDYSKRPTILVGLVGDDSERVQQFLKRWRTSRVDVDSKGKPCLERQMKVLAQGALASPANVVDADWDKADAEADVNLAHEQLLELVERIGGASWRDAVL